MEGLTQRQKAVLDYICKVIQKTGFSPTFREIKEHFGFASLYAVVRHINALVKKGYLKKGTRQFRGLSPTKGLFKPEFSQLIPIPEYSGSVPLGNTKELYDNIEELHWLSKTLTGPGDFVLFPVQGDSMVKAGIYSGDYVVIKRQENADIGDIILASYKGGVTLKRYGRTKNNEHLLIPENDNMEPITVPKDDKEFQIIGKMTILIRKANNLKKIFK